MNYIDKGGHPGADVYAVDIGCRGFLTACFSTKIYREKEKTLAQWITQTSWELPYSNNFIYPDYTIRPM